MKERPILFQGPMIRAVLEGRKTQTRRLVNLREFGESTTRGYQWTFRDRRARWQDLCHADMIARCPYGAPGDQLWVREAFTHITGNGIRVHYRADGEPTDSGGRVLPTEPGLRRWSPSIHMPRKASRLQLDVTEIRIERLQSISKQDAIAEGAQRFEGLADPSPYPSSGNNWSMESPTSHRQCLGSPQTAFGNFFIKLHGQDVWDANPWVWVVGFKPIEATAQLEQERQRAQEASASP